MQLHLSVTMATARMVQSDWLDMTNVNNDTEIADKLYGVTSNDQLTQ